MHTDVAIQVAKTLFEVVVDAIFGWSEYYLTIANNRQFKTTLL